MDKYITALLCFSAVVVGFAFYCGAKTVETKTVPIFLDKSEVFQDDKVEETIYEIVPLEDVTFVQFENKPNLAREIADSGEYDDSLATRQRFLVLPDSLYDLEIDQRYTLELFEDKFVDMIIVKREQLDEDKYLVRGNIKGKKHGTVSMVFYKNKGVAASVLIPGEKTIKIRYTRDGVHRITEREMARKKMHPIFQNQVNRHSGDIDEK